MKIVFDVPPFQPGLKELRETGGFEALCLEAAGEEARWVDPSLIHDADAVFCSAPPSNLDDMRSLRWIQLASSGYSQLFGLDLARRGIRASNCRGCVDTPIAEWNIAMMINLVRDLPRMLRNQAAGLWERPAVFQRELRGLTVGLWGYGGIGRETARLARTIGMTVHVLTRRGIARRDKSFTVPGTGDPEGVLPNRQFKAGEELEFLKTLDFLIISIPLTRVTEGLLGERELRALPPHAFVLNPARGPIIQEKALVRALQEKWFAGAALDTHYYYPLPPDHPLWRLPNVILTPHISGSSLTPSFVATLGELVVDNARRFADGRPLLNELTAAELDGN